MASGSSLAQPMKGRKVVVTRTPAQSRKIAALLESLGAEVIHFPTIEIADPSDWTQLDSAVAQISTYDWIVFTSANAVSRFMARVADAYGDAAAAMAGSSVFAIGPTTAEAVRAAGAQVSLTAEDSISEGALRSITENVGGEAGLRGLRILIPRARVARDFLARELRRLGAHVVAVEAYQTVRPLATMQMADLLTAGVDAITFTSPSTVSNFAALAGVDDLTGLLPEVLVACIGPSTSAAAFQHGFKRVIEPEKHNAAAMVEALARAFETSA